MTKSYWTAFLFAICAYMIRTSGIVLVIAMLIYLMLEKKYKPAVILTLMFAPFFLMFGTGGKYVRVILLKNPYDATLGNATFSEMVARVTTNFTLYVTKILPETLVPFSEWAGLSVIVGVILIYLIYKGVQK